MNATGRIIKRHGITYTVTCGSYHNMPADCYRIAVSENMRISEVLINNMRQILEV